MPAEKRRRSNETKSGPATKAADPLTQLQRLTARLAAGQVEPVYLFFGPDAWIRARALAAVTQALGVDQGLGRELGQQRLAGETASLADALSQLQNVPFGLVGHCLVVQDPSWLSEKTPSDAELDSLAAWAEEEAQARTHAPAQSALVITTASQPDRRRRLYKLLEKWGTVFECSHPATSRLAETATTWFQQRGVSVSAEAAELLATRAQGEMQLLEAEVEKLTAWSGGSDPIAEWLVRELTPADGAERVWSLINAATDGHPDLALQLARQLVRQGESVLGIIALLAREFRLIARTLGLQAEHRPLSELAVAPFVQRRTQGEAHQWDIGAVTTALAEIEEADLSIKTGRRSEELALDLLLTRLAALRTVPRR